MFTIALYGLSVYMYMLIEIDINSQTYKLWPNNKEYNYIECKIQWNVKTWLKWLDYKLFQTLQPTN